MNASVFPRATIRRESTLWEAHLPSLTPVEERAPNRFYKREDYFAPLGYGGINGSKLRQLIALVSEYVQDGGRAGILTGASVLSPQVSMAALVARHFELPCTVVVGGSKPETSIRHENVAIAAAAGAEFIHTKVGYNPALQRAVSDLHETDLYRECYRLCYGITTPSDASDAQVARFHAVGARQAENVPESVATLCMTAGSCNSCVSVLLGLARYPNNVRRVVLLGVGPTRLQWIEDRLAAIERATGELLCGRYRRSYKHHLALEAEHQTDGPVLLEHYDLHSTGWATYGDRMPWFQDGLDFHPTYEGKAFAYMSAHRNTEFAWFWRPAEPLLFWIVGSEPSLRAMQDAFIFDGIGIP